METYNFKPHVKGDTFAGVKFIVNIGGAPANLTGASIRIQLRSSPVHPVKHELSTSNGHISISNAVPGEFTINKIVIDFPAGNWVYDCEITFADGSKKTYFGGTFPIIQDVTR